MEHSYRLHRIMATNYVGAFCLTKILLPLLQNSPIPSRIVNVTSFTHRNGMVVIHFLSYDIHQILD